MSATPRSRRATFEDLARLGDARVEIIHGAIVDKALPTMEHAESQVMLSGFVSRRFRRGGGGRWPGGWWVATEIDVEYEAHQIFRHDVAGWRRDRVPERPKGRPVRFRPATNRSQVSYELRRENGYFAFPDARLDLSRAKLS
jgi:hypothetical protein